MYPCTHLRTYDVESTIGDLNKLCQEITPAPNDKGKSIDEWRSLIEQPGVHILVSWQQGRIIGMGTLIVVDIPTRIKAYIEDVAVLQGHRRLGIAQGIEQRLVKIAAQKGAPVAYLTSSRPPAQALWLKCGWQVGATNAYFKKTSSN